MTAIEEASATTLGAFEIRFSDMRAPESQERIDYALTNSGVPIVMTGRVGDKGAETKDTAADGDGKPAEPASAETTRDGANRHPPIDAGEHETSAPAPGGGTASSKPALAGKIVVPRAGGGYYDSRAAEVLKAEVQRASPASALHYEADTSVVVCVGGCMSSHMGVVFVQAKGEARTTLSGEMEQSSTSSADAAAVPRRDEIACIAGCYDDALRSHPALPPERTQQELQDAINRAGSGTRRSSAKPQDDWQTVPKTKAPAVSRQVRRHAARAPPSEKPGAWRTRIIESREPEKGEPEKGDPQKREPEKE